ncbi:uncharacterized protein LOC116853710 [Odontomachus brunneus]|uniref:uncharacterized protein LOC116853710 n=1 Tax=Odontomachus brunneus TaxID=486640 RepID=UPI0013F1DF2B|nr:uncharacterized protein LOC116853710 [Odontomachus brunneus]
MQSLMDHGRDCSRSRARDHRTINDGTHIDENVANDQPTDNTRLIVDEGGRTTMQVMAAAPRNGQSRPEKRHIKYFSLAEKVSAIDRVHGGESKASVARDIGVAESTLRGWCKSEHKIRSRYNNVAIGMGPRHAPVNIGRSMSANGRQSLATPDEDAPVAKKAKIDRTSRQNIPQTILPGPSTSLAGSLIGHNYNSDYAAALFAPMISSAQQNISTIWPTLDIMSRNYVSFAENGLQYTWTNNTILPTIASSTIVSNSAINTSSIDGVRNTMGNMIGNVMGNALDYTTGNRNIAVASTQGISSSYTRKSPSMTPAAEASTTPAPASSLPKKANCTRESKKTNIDLALSGNNIIGNIVGDDSSENRARSHSVLSERSESRENEDSSITAAERGTLTTPPVIEPTFSSEIMQALRVAKMNPNNTGIEQAIEYGTCLQKWLNNCSIPLLAKKQLREHKYIVDVLKSVKNVQLKPQSEVVPETCKASAGSHDEGTQL